MAAMSAQSSSTATSTRSCKCGDPSPVKVAWSKENLGRRYQNCWKFPSKTRCDFFEWLDPDESTVKRMKKLVTANENLTMEKEEMLTQLLSLECRIEKIKKGKNQWKKKAIHGEEAIKKYKNIVFILFLLVIVLICTKM